MSLARDLADLASVTTRLDTVGGSEGALSSRNVIINGAMQCWQRNIAATTTANGYSTVDRWKHFESGAGAYTTEQSTDHPTGTGYSLKFQVTTADTSIAANEYAFTETNLEGQDCQRFQYGTSNAKPITVSFWVKSNKTGIYCVALYKHAGAGTAYMYRKECTISAANTWEKKVVTISPTAGSTSLITASAAAVPNSNAMGLTLTFGLAWGSNYHGTDDTWQTGSGYGTSNQVNWMDSTSNNLYLTEVQMEVGDTATDFEHPRNFGDELLRCQRYYYDFQPVGTGVGNEQGIVCCPYGSNNFFGQVTFPVNMRATPTMASGGDWATRANNNNVITSAISSQRSSPRGFLISGTCTDVSDGDAFWLEPSSGTNPNTAYMNFSAEL